MPDYPTERLKLTHRLQGLSQGVGEEIAKTLEGALEKVSGKIAALAAKAEETESLVRRKKYLIKQKEEIERVLDEIYDDIGKEIKSKATEVAQAGPEITKTVLEKSLPAQIKIKFAVPSLDKNRVLQWWKGMNIEGAFFADYLKKLEGNTTQRILKEVHQSMVLSESLRETSKRIQQAVNAGRHGADALAHTAIFSAHNYAEREFFTENEDIISGLRYVAELDRRTCPQCVPLDQQEYTLKEAPIVPLHMRCRCYLEPIFKEKRIEAIVGKRIARLDTEARTVQHRDGTTSTKYTKRRVQQVPGNVSYNQWMTSMIKSKNPADVSFAREALGPTRFNLVASGKLKLEALLSSMLTVSLERYFSTK